MNWPALAAICSIFTALVTMLGVAYTYGALTTTVKDQAGRLEQHSARLDKQAETINDHDVKIGRINEWKDGLKLGAALHHKEQP